ncbi:hypothetical protein NEISICOT_03322 [Neisseria sicca ATCC 29256]|uniref:Uncharacterized protein n=1 Tax=Neisseria sicca ATCC 29256 TaxID=547045 RepID=C6M9U4_NEISI|nr:hypothetical protein NEISICOT_03322 [Neisseria sicca ATCC 29256]KJJ13776.1 hypothetical protein HMPREF3156_02225 [Neisseria sp. HMSC06F02]
MKNVCHFHCFIVLSLEMSVAFTKGRLKAQICLSDDLLANC